MGNFNYNSYPGRKQEKQNILEDIKPCISIVTPYYNSKDFFKETYNAVINQTFLNFEWIIVDDKSSRVEDVLYLKTFEGKDSRIRIFYKTENGGAASTLNYGIQQMQSEIFVPLNADDLIEPEFLEVVYIAMANQKIDCCYTNSVGFFDQEYLWDRELEPIEMKEKNSMVSCIACRKSKILEVGSYEEDLKIHYEDWEMWLKLMSTDTTFVKLNSYLFWYRRRGDSSLSKVEPEAMQKIKDLSLGVKPKIAFWNIEQDEVPFHLSILGKFNPEIAKREDEHALIILSAYDEEKILLIKKEIDMQMPLAKIIVIIPKITSGLAEKQQWLRDQIGINYVMADFLPVASYLEFIKYSIQFKNVKTIYYGGIFGNLVYKKLEGIYGKEIVWKENTSLKYENYLLELEEVNHEINYFKQYNQKKDKELFELRDWVGKLEEGKKYLEKNNQEKALRIEELEEWNKEVEKTRQYFVGKTQYLEGRVKELGEWNKEVEETKKYFEDKVEYLEGRVKELGEWNKEVEETKKYFEDKAEYLEGRVKELEEWNQEVEKAKKYFEDKTSQLEERNEELDGWIQQLEEAKVWLENETEKKELRIVGFEKEIESKNNEISETKNLNSKLNYKLNKLLNDKWIRRIIKLKKYDINGELE